MSILPTRLRRVAVGAMASSLLTVAALVPSAARVLAAVGDIAEYRVSPPASDQPSGITAGPDGNLWLIEANTVARVTTAGAVIEYPIPTANSQPAGIAAGPDGNLWFTESDPRANKVVKVTTTGVFTEYVVPTASSFATGIIAGPDGNLWFTEPAANKVAKVTNSGVFTEYAVPTASSQASEITAGPDGNLWFVEASGNNVAKVTTSGVFTEYAIPSSSSNPSGIAAGPDGKLWFTENGANKVANVTISGVFTEYAVPTASSFLSDIAAGPDGNLWFVEASGNKVAKVTTSGVFTEYAVPTTNADPNTISAGPDGNLWFTESAPNQVAKVTISGVFTEYPMPPAKHGAAGIVSGPDGNLWMTEFGSRKVASSGDQSVAKVTTSGVVTHYALPTFDGAPNSIAAGSDGNLWVTEANGNKVAKVTTSGVVTEYTVPTAHSSPSDIAAGPDGNLWFTEYGADKVAKLTTSGAFMEYAVPTAGGNPAGITAGPDGNLWFTEFSGNKVAKLTTAGVITEYAVPTASSFPSGITAGPDGNLWVAEWGATKVARVTTSGVFTEYAAPSRPASITAGPGGSLWFTDGGSYVARVTTTGGFTQYPTPTGSFSFPESGGITAGADGNVWFTEFSPNQVAKVSTGFVPPSCPAAASTPSTVIASSTNQHILTNSDGSTWQEINAANLRVTCTPVANQSVLLTANADLFTASAGFNQDIGIFVSDNGGADQLLAWKESGGFAGTFSPNAAYAQALFNESSGHSYVFKLKWKTNKNAPGAAIYSGAGPISGRFSPTSLVAENFPTGVTPDNAVSTQQYTQSNSDGATWVPMDATNLKATLTPVANSTAVLGANVDLFTANSGVNQDVAVFVSDNGGAFTLVAWKESGGFAGSFSPNAAFVKETYPMTGGHTYLFRLEWKSNKDAPGTTIYAGAGPSNAQFSPTSLVAQTIASGANPYSAVSTSQYTLSNSNGVTWQAMDAALNIIVTPGADINCILGANADLFTNTAGYNQDIGIFVSDNGGADTLVAWKESGGFAGTFSPNAAFAQDTYQMVSGHTYLFKLKWKTNGNAPGTTIYAAAGGTAPFSPTRLTVELTN